LIQGVTVEAETELGTTGAEAALAHRLEALAAQADEEQDLPVGPVLAASLTGLRAEINGMRTDLESVRAQVLRPGSPRPTPSPGGESSGLADAVEGRLAAIEDTLDGLAERFEALARNSAMDAGERLASLDDRLAALTQSLHAERTAAADHRERSGLALQSQAGSLDDWAAAVHSGLEELSEAVTASLGSLSTSVTAASTNSRDAERRHVEALIAELSQTVEESSGAIAAQVEAYGAPIDGRLQDLHDAVLDGFGGARARLIEELSGTISRLEHANSATQATVTTELTELRGDLADALEEVRERVEATVSGANEAINANLDLVRERFESLVAEASESISANLDEVHGRLETTVGGASESIGASLEEHQAGAATLREGITAAAEHSKDSGERVASLEAIVTRVDATLSALQSDWRPQVDAVVAEGRAAAQGVLDQVHSEVDAALATMSTALSSQAQALTEVTGSLGGGTDRLVTAGRTLLAYLGERDRLLERERDRVLHEVLDEFAQGLSAKERRAVSSRMGEALDRRRDARDAERFRRTEAGKPAIEIPEAPAALSQLADPIVPRPSDRPSSAASKTDVLRGAAAKKTTAAKKTAAPAKTAAAKKATAANKTVAAKKTTAAKKTAAPRKTAAAKKATAAKAAAAKTAATKAAPGGTATAGTGAKRAAATKRASESATKTD
jgi:BMFP domain-containing protein YqiC